MEVIFRADEARGITEISALEGQAESINSIGVPKATQEYLVELFDNTFRMDEEPFHSNQQIAMDIWDSLYVDGQSLREKYHIELPPEKGAKLDPLHDTLKEKREQKAKVEIMAALLSGEHSVHVAAMEGMDPKKATVTPVTMTHQLDEKKPGFWEKFWRWVTRRPWKDFAQRREEKRLGKEASESRFAREAKEKADSLGERGKEFYTAIERKEKTKQLKETLARLLQEDNSLSAHINEGELIAWMMAEERNTYLRVFGDAPDSHKKATVEAINKILVMSEDDIHASLEKLITLKKQRSEAGLSLPEETRIDMLEAISEMQLPDKIDRDIVDLYEAGYLIREASEYIMSDLGFSSAMNRKHPMVEGVKRAAAVAGAMEAMGDFTSLPISYRQEENTDSTYEGFLDEKVEQAYRARLLLDYVRDHQGEASTFSELPMDPGELMRAKTSLEAAELPEYKGVVGLRDRSRQERIGNQLRWLKGDGLGSGDHIIMADGTLQATRGAIAAGVKYREINEELERKRGEERERRAAMAADRKQKLEERIKLQEEPERILHDAVNRIGSHTANRVSMEVVSDYEAQMLAVFHRMQSVYLHEELANEDAIDRRGLEGALDYISPSEAEGAKKAFEEIGKVERTPGQMKDVTYGEREQAYVKSVLKSVLPAIENYIVEVKRKTWEQDNSSGKEIPADTLEAIKSDAQKVAGYVEDAMRAYCGLDAYKPHSRHQEGEKSKRHHSGKTKTADVAAAEAPAPEASAVAEEKIPLVRHFDVNTMKPAPDAQKEGKSKTHEHVHVHKHKHKHRHEHHNDKPKAAEIGGRS